MLKQREIAFIKARASWGHTNIYIYILTRKINNKKNKKAYLVICLDLGKYLEKLGKVKERKNKERKRERKKEENMTFAYSQYSIHLLKHNQSDVSTENHLILFI